MDGTGPPDSENYVRKRTRKDIDLNIPYSNLIPDLPQLQVLPSQPKDSRENSPTSVHRGQKFLAGDCGRLKNPRCSGQLTGQFDWHRLEIFSMDKIKYTASIRVRCNNEGETGHGDPIMRNTGISQPRMLYLLRTPTMKLAYQDFMNLYKVPLFPYTFAGYISEACGIRNVSDLELTLSTCQSLRCQISVWDYTRFLTKSTRLKQRRTTLGDDPYEEIVYSEPSLKCKSPTSLTAAVIMRSEEMTEVQAVYLCRVRIIFALPQEIREILPTLGKGKFYIPSRLAFVEWYFPVKSSDGPFFEISPIDDVQNKVCCGIISLTDIRGTVPLSSESNTFLVTFESLEAIARRPCIFDPYGKYYKSFLNSDT